MARRWLGDEKGNVLLFTTAMMVFLLVMAGIAIDLGYLALVDNEVQRAMDAAALAGAGNLGFDDSVFPAVRLAAQTYARRNAFHNGTINLDLNTANDANGDIVLGVWDPTKSPKFQPSTDGTAVNAVRCHYQTSIPTSFLRLLGFSTLGVSAQAIAIANPPATPPPDT
jgi:Flp pilus assembly protein TadG